MNPQDYAHEHIREYVEAQCHGEERVEHLELVARRHLLGQHYEIWDVWTDESRWWVISPLTNLYSQDDFRSMEMAFVYHLGVVQVLSARPPRRADPRRTRALNAWRKWDQAGDALDEAQEAEDFQAVAMRIREGLIAFAQALARPEYVPVGEESPQRANFIKWAELIADNIAPGSSLDRVRGHLKDTARTTWQLVSWLTHASDATRTEAELAISACDHLGVAFIEFEVKHTKGPPKRCPECSSYKVVNVWRSETSDYAEMCEVCDWQEPEDANQSANA